MADRSGLPHRVPLYLACRDHGVWFGMARPHSGALAFKEVGPCLVVIDDDEPGKSAVGPAGFHQPSLRQFIARAAAVLFSAGPPVLSDYFSIAAVAAVLRKDAMIAETKIAQEIPWMELARETNGLIQVVASTGAGIGGRQ